MAESLRAPVRPRVIVPDLDDVVLLEDEIADLIERDYHGRVWLVGGPGMGKRTAMRHLKSVFGDTVRLRNEPHRSENQIHIEARTRAFHLPDAPNSPQDGIMADAEFQPRQPSYWMPPWSHDEFIEYLLAEHRDRCASVMQRIYQCPDLDRVHGVVELCRIVLDEMALNDECRSTGEALLGWLMANIPTENGLAELCQVCLDQTTELGLYKMSFGSHTFMPIKHTAANHCAEVARVFYHEPLITLLATERLLSVLTVGEPHEILNAKLPEPLVQEAGPRIEPGGALEKRLRETFYAHVSSQPMAASLLHAAGIGWRPGVISKPNLIAAYLAGCEWPDVVLPGALLRVADLSGGNLAGAHLRGASLLDSDLSGAQLARANLSNTLASGANFSRANLSWCYANGANFRRCDMSGADLSHGSFQNANFAKADLRRANLGSANLQRASLTDAQWDEAVLSGACLANTELYDVDFRSVSLDFVDFTAATLHGCNFECVEMPGACFRGAYLNSANFTATHNPGAEFRYADLSSAYLAEIDWEGADLRNAILAHASFHMGTSRSGLVDSPYASEGTRTGFYTDDYNDQDYKPPEEFRKANLCGADLRGADITGVDFYLVDLRFAKYDADQARQMARTGAILHPRQVN